MAKYGYKAFDAAGKIKKGSIEADTVEAARGILKQQGMNPISIGEQSLLNSELNIEIGGNPKPRDLSVFCRQFVSMTRAGVSILEALKLLSEQTENKKLQKAVEGVRASVEKGQTLSDSLKEYPKVFPELMINLVAAGEASGSLDIALERMATQLEKATKIRAMTKKAMIYPIMVFLVAIVVVVFMLIVVIPKYTEMFRELDTELPAITRGVVTLSDGLKAYWFIVVPALVLIVVGLSAWRKTDSGKHVIHKLKLKIPALGKLESKSACSLMARTLSTLMASGVPLVEGVDIVSSTMTNVYFREALEKCRDGILIGQPLSRPLEECGMFPPMVYHMTRIGEESGNVEEMLAKMADYYDEEVEMAVQSLMEAMQPFIIILLAGIVGYLVAACLAPMLGMYGSLNNL